MATKRANSFRKRDGAAQQGFIQTTMLDENTDRLQDSRPSTKLCNRFLLCVLLTPLDLSLHSQSHENLE